MQSKIDTMLAEASAKDRKLWTTWLTNPEAKNTALADVFGVGEASVRRWRATNNVKDNEPPKILIFDIESSPILGYTWALWEQNVIDIVQDWKLLTVSYTWYGSGKYQAMQLCDFKGYKKGKLEDLKLSEFVRDLLSDADYAVAHNGDAFDIKKVNAKFAEHTLAPPSPVKQIDTLKVARSKMKMSSNKLDSLGQTLGVGRKMKHSGFETWLGCMAGDVKAWEEMRKYAIQDVRLLEAVFEKLLPWVSGLNYGLFLSGSCCTSCGSPDLIPEGHYLSATRKTQAYRCQACGSISKLASVKSTK